MIQSDNNHHTFFSASDRSWEEALQKLWRKYCKLIYLGLGAGVMVAFWTLSLPNHYKSETRILPADSRNSGGGGTASATAAAMGVSIPGQESPDAVLVDILNSRSLREALLQTKFSFRIQSWYFGPYVLRNQTLYNYLASKNVDRAIKTLREHILVTRDIKTKLITVVVETESPELSQMIAQTLVRLLDEYVVSKSRTRGSIKAAFSENRLIEARMELSRAEDTYRIFLDSNRNYNNSNDASVRLKGIRLDNELKLRTQLVATLTINREQALLEEKNDMPILNILDQGNLPIDKSKPDRFNAVLRTTLIFWVAGWLWLNRIWVQALIRRQRLE